MSSIPRKGLAVLACLTLSSLVVGPAFAADCGNDASGFQAWIGRFKQTAAAQGISGRALGALDGLSYDANTVRLDHSQRSFHLSFEQFYARRVSSSMISRGKSHWQTHRALFDRVEQRFGVPAPVLLAIWGLETNYGGDGAGRHTILRSIATLAYDCRRPDFFRNELTSALRIIDRGDLTASQMVGGWAGEIGQVQFLPSNYFKYAVDFDGDGRKDLVRSVPDMMASVANFLKAHGWRAGGGWAPGSANYGALQEWNKAEVYQRTIAVMADKIAGR